MKGEPTSFWGKLIEDEEGGVREWHPVSAHCADVAACAEALLERTLLGRRLAVLGGRDVLTRTEVARLSAIAALHDIGKFNHGFQRKARRDAKGTAGHVAEVLALLGSGYPEERALRRALPLELIDSWAGGHGLELLVAAVCHHGRPVSVEEVRVNPALWARDGGRDPFEGIAGLGAATRKWFPEAFASDGALLPATPAGPPMNGVPMGGLAGSSPRERGSTPIAGPRERRHDVFPARAGVHP